MAHDPAVKARAIALLLAGNSIGKTAEQLGLSKASVQNWKREIDQGRINTAYTPPNTPPQVQIHPGAPPPSNTNNTTSNTQKKSLGGLLEELLYAEIESLIAATKVHADPTYLERQSGTDLAMLHGTKYDKVIKTVQAREQSPNQRRPEGQPALPLDSDGQEKSEQG